MHPTPPLVAHSALLSTTAPTSPLTPTTLGFYLRTRPHGFAAHVCATPQNLYAVRQLARVELLAQGIEDDAVDSAQLVLSEIVGNSVRAYGDYVPTRGGGVRHGVRRRGERPRPRPGLAAEAPGYAARQR